MAIQINGAPSAHSGVEILAGAALPSPGAISVVYSVMADALDHQYNTMLGVMRETYSGNEYTFTAALEFGGTGQPKRWCLSDGTDNPSGPVATTQTGQWLRQGYRVDTASTDHVKRFWHDFVGAPTTFADRTAAASFYPSNGANHRFRVGDVPWSESEHFVGKIAFIKIFSAALSDADMATEAANVAPTSAAGIANLWARYDFPNGGALLNDTSGNNRHVSQITPANPVVWTADPTIGGGTPAAPTGLNITGITTSTANAAWNASAGATGYRWRRTEI